MDRNALIKEVVAKVRKLSADGVSRDILQKIARELEQLVAHGNLFTRDEFPPPLGNTNILYTLSCDPDGRYALYLSSANVGKSTPPHNHATWAVILGIEGEELNKLYVHTDKGGAGNNLELREVGEHVVQNGNPICLMPEDIHSIHVKGNEPTFHLHMYGKRLEDLTERLQFDPATGEGRHFPPNPNIR